MGGGIMMGTDAMSIWLVSAEEDDDLQLTPTPIGRRCVILSGGDCHGRRGFK